MVMVTQNSAQEVEAYIKENTPAPKEEPKTEVKAEPAKEAIKVDKDDDDDDIPFAERLGLTEAQSKAVTEAFRREIGKKNLRRKEAEEFAASQYTERRLAEERAQRLAQELEEARKAIAPPKEKTERPDRTKFSDPNEYEDALLAWNRAESIREFKAQEAKEREEAEKQQIIAAARERVRKAIELVPDFEARTADATEIVPPHIAAKMQKSELFPEIALHFAEHPEDLQRLAEMPTRTYSDLMDVGVAFDKIQSKIQPFAKAKATDASKASTNGHAPSSDTGSDPNQDTGIVPSQPRTSAPVIQPLSVGSSSQVEKPESRMSYSEARAKFEKEKGINFSRRSRH